LLSFSDITTFKSDGEATNIRKNQQQVDVDGYNVGTNRPDLQYDVDGKHYNVEYGNSTRNSERHGEQIRRNDPISGVELNMLR
jgi:hypothetical protein